MNIIEEVENLAAKEREVRKLEMLIEYVTSLKEEDLAKVLAGLASARKGWVLNAAPPLSAASTPDEAPRGILQQPVSVRNSSGVVLRRFTSLLKTKNAV
ncbi:MAG: hypothetical protein ACREQ2_12245 [Candidatus Binatia bacterium]